ncbi:MAG: hypothetical protein DRJ61_06840 [Acidobacteria bacterium]|nr:MAG: hypothetical protein DRJ61_06840 [Acidobacteriota bacterium]
MKARILIFSMVVALVSGAMFPAAAWAQDEGYERPVTQTEFAIGVVGAILGQDRSLIDGAEAMKVLKDRGIVPATWTGEGNVSMGDAAHAFQQLGFQIYVEESELLLSSGVFEQILRHHMGEIKKTKHHWDIVHHFSMGLELGEYRERILGPNDEHGGSPISPSGF